MASSKKSGSVPSTPRRSEGSGKLGLFAFVLAAIGVGWAAWTLSDASDVRRDLPSGKTRAAVAKKSAKSDKGRDERSASTRDERADADKAEEQAKQEHVKSDDAEAKTSEATPSSASGASPSIVQKPDSIDGVTPSAPPSIEGSRAIAPSGNTSLLIQGRANRESPVLALTFDAGADDKPVASILRTLQKRGLHCTFFLTGKFCDQFPAASRQIAQAGHEIANHSYSHPHFTKLTDNGIRMEIAKAEASIEKATGQKCAPYFRPPFGDRNKRVDSLLASLGYRTVLWSLDSHDSVVKGITAKQIADRVLQKSTAGSIVLVHCGSQATADALPQILDEYEKRHYRLVCISEMAR